MTGPDKMIMGTLTSTAKAPAGRPALNDIVCLLRGFTVAKPELGTKRVCPETGRKFYDLGRDPIVSPYTGKSYPLAFFDDSAAKEAEKDEEEELEEVDAEESGDAETVSLEEADAEDDGAKKSRIPDADNDDDGDDDVEIDNDDDDTFLPDEDDDDDDMSDIIGDVNDEDDEN